MFDETAIESWIDFLKRFHRINPYSELTITPTELQELIDEIERMRE